MKLIDYLKELNIVDFNTNPYRIDEVTIKTKERTAILSFVFANALKINEYKAFQVAVLKKLKESEMNANIMIGYEKQNLSEEDCLTYYNDILDNLLTISPRYNALKNVKTEIVENTIKVYVEADARGIDDLASEVEEEFVSYGLDIKIEVQNDETRKIADVIETINQTDDKLFEESIKQNEANKQKAETIAKANKRKYYTIKEVSKIEAIPNSTNDISIYKNTIGVPEFCIEAEVFAMELKKLPKTSLLTLKVTDESDSIVVKKWVRSKEEIDSYSSLKEGDILKITGLADYDSFSKNVVLTASNITFIGKKQVQEILDEEPVKRVELHCHSKMSNLDGITEASDYVKQALKWGHKAIAITDHGGVYAIPDINHASEGKDIKPIFGAEFAYLDEATFHIAFTNEDINLKNAKYVVFDFETTGLSQHYDTIIEIAAVKVYQGAIIDKFETFVNPERPITPLITKLTSIDDEMVRDSRVLKDILPEFIDFCEGCILVAHNAAFDIGMLYALAKNLGITTKNYPVIDTLNALRAMHGTDLKKFNLEAMAKFFKVKQEHHHRAIDDTKVTAECFLYILQEMLKRGVTNYANINTLIDENEFFKHTIPNHINFIAKNETGYRNMFRIVSDALTTHCYGEGRVLRSVLEKYREGILVGSGCVNGKVFENALHGALISLEEEMSFYDYIEVQPPRAYMQLFDSVENGEAVVEQTILDIITCAKKLGKIVVATSDCHYLRPNMKHYRDILIASPQIGGGIHKLKGMTAPDLHFRTTREMLDEFAFLGTDLAYEIVVTNTNLVADSIEKIECFHKEMFTPADDEFKDSLGVPSIVEDVKRIVNENLLAMYGENPHLIVKNRINRELTSIIDNGYSSVYYMSHLLVKKSNSDGYIVGSRGSVGSSLVATMMKITEINPLSPHYRCPKCKFQVFKMNEEEKTKYGISENEELFQSILSSVESGYDLPDAVCPCCGSKLIKDGHDIPFETFLGFNGDKVPDIDLNFSGLYQSSAHEYVRTLMGGEHAFRSGTVATIAENTAYGYVKAYCEKNNKNLRTCEIDRIASKLVGVKRSTGQHPGGIIVVPRANEIFDVTPVQYPADNIDNSWRTTHFDYHSFENNLLKLDILGHDDPTVMKFLMDYVHDHQSDYPFSEPQGIPIDDPNIYRLFYSTSVIGVKPEDIDSTIASYAVPEFGTNFVRQMLVDTMPKTFGQLVKISGLSHGTDVWAGNASDLVNGKTEFGKIPFADVIGCRDDIMVYLLYRGLEPIKAFEIMEFVRRGKPSKDPVKWEKYKTYMRENKIPEWYIWSCERIKYMFPKAHATAYVLSALRLAWFKVNSPLLFYSAYFSMRAPAYSVDYFLKDKFQIKERLRILNANMSKTAKDEDVITVLQVAMEMVARGYKFLPVDINLSDAKVFLIEDGALRIPFVAVDGLGESVALDIVAKRNEKAFTSKRDVSSRTKLSQTLFDYFNESNFFGNLPDDELEEAQGLFAFLD